MGNWARQSEDRTMASKKIQERLAKIAKRTSKVRAVELTKPAAEPKTVGRRGRAKGGGGQGGESDSQDVPAEPRVQGQREGPDRVHHRPVLRARLRESAHDSRPGF